jgi:hypothetical protein
MVSYIAVEKVVNPPQNPVVRRSLVSGEINVVERASSLTKPMTKEPNRFTDSVA